MTTNYKTIIKCKCKGLNENKSQLMLSFKQWIQTECERAKLKYAKGYTHKKVYHSLSKRISSVYRSKIANVGNVMYEQWLSRKSKARALELKYTFGNSSMLWFGPKQISKFEIRKTLNKEFQVYAKIKLPFKMDGRKEVSLVAKLNKKDWPKLKDVYAKGFCLKISRNEIAIHLISKNNIVERKPGRVKAIYASPYGGLHMTTFKDFVAMKQEGIDDCKSVEDSFFKVCYGISRESKAMLKLLEKIKSCTHRNTFVKDVELLRLKCRTRVNKFMQNIPNDISSIAFVRIKDNSSSIANIIQEGVFEQLKKHCFAKGIKLRVVEFSMKEIQNSAIWCMNKSDREDAIANKKPAPNAYRVLAGLKKYYKKSNINVRLGLINIRKQKGMFHEMFSTPEMSQVDYVDTIKDDDFVFT